MKEAFGLKKPSSREGIGLLHSNEFQHLFSFRKGDFEASSTCQKSIKLDCRKLYVLHRLCYDINKVNFMELLINFSFYKGWL